MENLHENVTKKPKIVINNNKITHIRTANQEIKTIGRLDTNKMQLFEKKLPFNNDNTSLQRGLNRGSSFRIKKTDKVHEMLAKKELNEALENENKENKNSNKPVRYEAIELDDEEEDTVSVKEIIDKKNEEIIDDKVEAIPILQASNLNDLSEKLAKYQQILIDLQGDEKKMIYIDEELDKLKEEVVTCPVDCINVLFDIIQIFWSDLANINVKESNQKNMKNNISKKINQLEMVLEYKKNL